MAFISHDYTHYKIGRGLKVIKWESDGGLKTLSLSGGYLIHGEQRGAVKDQELQVWRMEKLRSKIGALTERVVLVFTHLQNTGHNVALTTMQRSKQKCFNLFVCM